MSCVNGIERIMKALTKHSIALLFVLLMSASQVAALKPKSQIRTVDFSNFTYPQFWGRKLIGLKNGRLEFESEGCHTEYKLNGVNYVDLTGDRKEEALVHVEDFTACGSSGVSDYYYVYTMRNDRPRLLWRFGSGSEGTAGLKSFNLEGHELVFELFGKYWIAGSRFIPLGEDSIGECCPTHYSRIRVAWDGRRFRQRSIEIFPFPYQSITDYYIATGFPRR
jgi:hypothetical protein